MPRSSRYVVLAAIAACGSPPEASAPPVAAVPVTALLACGEREAVATYAGDSVVAVLDGTRFVLRQALSASGARYADPVDSTTTLWNKGAETTITLRGETWPLCGEEPTRPFVARGNEPGWMLTIDTTAITLLADYGADTVHATVAMSDQGAGFTRHVAAPPANLAITIRDGGCTDASTGMPHPFAVEVARGAGTVHGCGGDPASLLQGEEWTILTLGSDTTATPRPTLTFFRSGRVAGSTSCNRLMGRYAVGGEGITLGAAATTRRACLPPVGGQESAFLDAYGRVRRFELDGGTLRLLAGDAPAMTARRTSAAVP